MDNSIAVERNVGRARRLWKRRSLVGLFALALRYQHAFLM